MLGLPYQLKFHFDGATLEERHGYQDPHCKPLRCGIFVGCLYRTLPEQRFVCLGIPCGFCRRNRSDELKPLL